MSNIENLFKHKIPFNFISEHHMEGPLSETLFCTNDTIKNGNSIGVYSIDDLFNKLKPFISYLRSIITTETTFRDQPLKSKYDILLRVKDETYKEEPFLCSVIRFTLNKGDPNIGFIKIETSCNKYLRSSFEIYVRVLKLYPLLPGDISRRFYEHEDDSDSDNESEEVEIENEYDDDMVEPKPLEESFRIDKCVICLENEPNILFTDCNHICTCLECEKIKPTVKCSYCRTEISRKIKIKKKKKKKKKFPINRGKIFYLYPVITECKGSRLSLHNMPFIIAWA